MSYIASHSGFKGTRRPRGEFSSCISNSNLSGKNLLVKETTNVNNVTVETGDVDILTGGLNITGGGIVSKGLTGTQGFTVGGTITKDMNVTGIDSLPSDYAPNNIGLSQNEYQASYWSDWGGDIFDDWGFFYIFNVETNCLNKLTLLNNMVILFSN